MLNVFLKFIITSYNFEFRSNSHFYSCLKKLMTIGPKEMWFGQNGTGASVFTTSNSDYGVRMSSYTQKDLEAGEIPKGKKVGEKRGFTSRKQI